MKNKSKIVCHDNEWNKRNLKVKINHRQRIDIDTMMFDYLLSFVSINNSNENIHVSWSNRMFYSCFIAKRMIGWWTSIIVDE